MGFGAPHACMLTSTSCVALHACSRAQAAKAAVPPVARATLCHLITLPLPADDHRTSDTLQCLHPHASTSAVRALAAISECM